MDELIFLVEEAPEGGLTARALGASIFTEADDLATLREQVRDAVRCHYETGQGPRLIRTCLRSPVRDGLTIAQHFSAG